MAVFHNSVSSNEAATVITIDYKLAGSGMETKMCMDNFAEVCKAGYGEVCCVRTE